MKGKLDVGVIGAGTAGAATGIFLARMGHRVTVYEKVARPGPVGAGLLLQPTGMTVLEQLGLLESILSRGARVERLFCRTHSGRVVLDLRYSDHAPSTFGLGLHRGVLFEALVGALARSSALFRPGVEVATVHRTRQGRLRLAGRSAGEASSIPLADHDLVVVSEGARSEQRSRIRSVVRDRIYPWGAMWFVVEDAERVFRGELHQVVDGAHTMLGTLPTGFGPPSNERVGAAADSPLVSVFFSVPRRRQEQFLAQGLEPFRRRAIELDARTAALFDQLTDVHRVVFAEYRDVAMRRLCDRRLVFAGDAGHAMSPQLGQGANLALIDALVLSTCIERASDVDQALHEYDRLRRSHLSYYRFATRLLTPFFQSDSRFLALLRDAFLGWACRAPWIRTKMLQTLAGVSRGPFSRPLELPPPKAPS